MIRVSLASLTLAAALGLLGPVAVDAIAQSSSDGEASRLVPAEGPMRLTPNRPAPVPVTPSTPTRAALNRAPPLGGRIQVEGLSAIDPNSIGLWEEKDGGLGAKMWQGTPRGLIEKLLPRLPKAMSSRLARRLVRKLLLSTAEMPPAAANASPSASGHDLLIGRIAALQTMGIFKQARKLVALAPGRHTDPELLRLKADDRLLANDYGGACQIVPAAGDRLTELYWQSLLVFCQALQGDIEGASLGASLLADRGQTDDPVFFSLIDRMTNANEIPIESLSHPTPLHIAMLRTAQIPIPDDAVGARSPAILRTVGISPNARFEVRLGAAERAARLGALTTQHLAEIYMAMKFDETELNNALSLSAADRSPRGRALLYQSARIETVAMARASIVSKAFEIAREEGAFAHTLRLYRELLFDLPISPEMVWFAPEAIRGLHALDRPVPARPWLDLLRQAAARDDEYKSHLDASWFLGFLATPRSTPENEMENAAAELEASLVRWRAALLKRDPEEANTRMVFALKLLEALGHEIPDNLWWSLLEKPNRAARPSGDPAYRAALRRAAAGGRRAETVLLAILLIGADGARREDAGTNAAAISALRAVGLEEDARLLAIETAVIAGL